MILKDFIGRKFRAREIFVRIDDRVRYVRLSSGVQVAAFVLFTGSVAWAAYATIAMNDRADRIAFQSNQISTLERDRLRLGGELAATRAYFANAKAEMARQTREIRRLAALRGGLESQLLGTQARLAEMEAEYQGTRVRSDELANRLADLNSRIRQRDVTNHMLLTRLSETGSALAGATMGQNRANELRRERERELADLQASLQSTESLNSAVREKLDDQRREMAAIVDAREMARTEVRRLSSKVTALNSDLDEAYRYNSSLRRRLAATSDALTETHRHQVVAEQRGQHLAQTIGSLEARLSQVRKTQLELLRGIREKAQNNIASLKITLSQTGVPMEELLHSTIRRTSGLGGPLVALTDELENEGDENFESMVTNLELELLQWESMQTLMEHLPLARPTRRGYVSSPYGKRRDPISGRRAFHKGVDIAAPTHTPIHATAGGVVIFAGTKAAYGRIVEIDHGYDFVTRYAHLRKILVKKGQRVRFNDEVAKMGSSGRSTGSHVHYEVLYDGNQMDPTKFFEAGRHVFKVQQASR